VRADPATVDVYCGKCHNDAGSLVQGIAKSSTQIASSVPAAGVKWWKVGQFVAPSPKDNAVRAQWETCQSGCYTGTTNNVPGATRRRRSTGPTDVKPALQDADVVHGDPYMNKIMASRLKKADKEREERIALKTAKKEQRGEKMNSLMHKRARYYNLKNTDGGGIRSTYSTPDDAKKKDHVKNAGREWTENDKKVVMPFIRNIQSLKHAWAKRYGLDTMEEAINTARASPKDKKFRVRSVDSPAGPREAMCYVYDEAYKNWVPWGPNSMLQIHDWDAIWNRPHWPQYEQVYKPTS